MNLYSQFSYFLNNLRHIRCVSPHDAIYEFGVALKKVKLLLLYVVSGHSLLYRV